MNKPMNFTCESDCTRVWSEVVPPSSLNTAAPTFSAEESSTSPLQWAIARVSRIMRDNNMEQSVVGTPEFLEPRRQHPEYGKGGGRERAEARCGIATARLVRVMEPDGE